MGCRSEVDAAVLKDSRAGPAVYAELTKPRITLFVTFSSAVGFVLGSSDRVDLFALCHTVIATALIAGGAAALNQFLERREDARMRRTDGRPLPSGRMLADQAYVFGALMSAVGMAYMGIAANWAASLLGGLTSAIYLLAYTPLKQRTSLNTVVGAVAGALPPVGGWAAAHGWPTTGAWILFAVLFFWQIPHFFAIAWIYRDDYARGGYRMVPVQDARGSITAYQIGACSLALLAVSLLPYVTMGAGVAYLLVAAVVGLGMLAVSFRFYRHRTTSAARMLLRATLVYLPALWTALVSDRLAT